MKKWLIGIIGLLVILTISIVVFNIYHRLTTYSPGKTSDNPTVYLSLGTLTNDETKIWQYVVNADEVKNLGGNQYEITVQQFNSVQQLESALKSQDVFFGIGLTQQDIDTVNHNPSVVAKGKTGIVPLASTHGEFKGLTGYKGLKQGGLITSAVCQYDEYNGPDKQKMFVDKIINIYNNQSNQAWITKNYPNYQ